MADLDKLYSVIKEEKGYLDILFANAGGGDFAPLGSITEKLFDDTFNLNVKGVLFTVQKALPIFKDGGSIILTASIATVKETPTLSVYFASKAAVRSFARCWSVDWKERKIRVNALSPGAIDTPALRAIGKNEEETKQYIAGWIAGTPMNYLGTSEEVAKAVVFLASDDSSYITGIELFVDGGAAQI
jgi:NAD(P)-dependent dehydrogenase (short-subunit alcohol dehydrogenase family)